MGRGAGDDMSIYALKSRFQDLLRPLVGALHRAGATANQVTAAALLVSLAVAWAVWRLGPAAPAWYLLLPAWMFVRMAFNAIDGMLAREFGQKSRTGAYLNELSDVIADAALYLSLASVAGMSLAVLWLFAWLAALTEYAGVLGLMVGASRRYDGPMGKSDRAFVVGAAGLALALGWLDGRMLGWIIAAAAVLCAVTVLRRMRAGLQEAAVRGDGR